MLFTAGHEIINGKSEAFQSLTPQVIDIPPAELQTIARKAAAVWLQVYGATRLSGSAHRVRRVDKGVLRKEPEGRAKPSMAGWLRHRHELVSCRSAGSVPEPESALDVPAEIRTPGHDREVQHLKAAGLIRDSLRDFDSQRYQLILPAEMMSLICHLLS